MIPYPVYVGFPAIVGLLLLIALTFSYRGLPATGWAVDWSYRLALLHCALACVAVLLTVHDAISPAACRTGVYGFRASLAFAGLDGLSLLWWLIVCSRTKCSSSLTRPVLFVLLRMLVHAALGGAFLWCAVLCTV